MNKRIRKKKLKQFIANCRDITAAINNWRESNERMADAFGGIGALLRSMRARDAEPTNTETGASVHRHGWRTYAHSPTNAKSH